MSDPIQEPPLGVPDDPHTDNPSAPPPGDPGVAAGRPGGPGENPAF